MTIDEQISDKKVPKPSEVIIDPKELIGKKYNDAWIAAGGAKNEVVHDRLVSFLLPESENYVIDDIEDARDITALAGCNEPNVLYSDGENEYIAPTHVAEENKP